MGMIFLIVSGGGGGLFVVRGLLRRGCFAANCMLGCWSSQC